MAKNKKPKEISNKKNFIECLIFTIIFIILTIFSRSLSGLIFVILSTFFTIIFYKRYKNENKD